MGVPISLSSCRWFTEDDVESWLRRESKSKIFGPQCNLLYHEYIRKLLPPSSALRLHDKHGGKIICFEKIKDGRVSRTQYIDRINEGLMITNDSKNIFGRAFLHMNPKHYPLGVQRHQHYGKCLLSSPAKIIAIFVTLDSVPQRLCRQHGHSFHIPDSFFSWLVTDENEHITVDIPLWCSDGRLTPTPDILKNGKRSSSGWNTPRSRMGELRKERWVSHLTHGSACVKAFNDFVRSLSSGNHEIGIEIGFMYDRDKFYLLPLEKSQSESGRVWKNDLYCASDLTSVDLSKEKGFAAYPSMLASGTFKLHKS